ncbi:SOS response-associated peptidase [Nodularia sphaerocarpa]|uniref:SOS response-associated peptidase n=1 Tax=Nodularia sphaerocarpa TaxID=137816 RepID=UPI001EFA8B9D|nr:SOS response-associated peptidase [Nodularia sphaerocarpa]MDB9372774.1 SOS response-associated peptidase [Nodularia sphaerocarpa CS-585]MDB9378539.1 SOS response-associated peptidase [Nodularia sphaerocarpa CS-585A2]ULP70613.1 Putative SOS response-associated peptidase YedK [Nodularia sphaerocarpa UHCC 0038]
MCGRFTLNQSLAALAEFFHVENIPNLAAQYNIAPTQRVATVIYNPQTEKREFQQLRWGLIPSWAKDPKIGVKLINARAETVAEKPAFRSAFKQRRCLVLSDGFYEWKQQNGKKQPFYFRLRDGQPFGFAGLWERWQPLQGKPDCEEIISCTILTTAANELVKPIHERMPVIVSPQDYDLWLNPQMPTPERLQQLLCPYPDQVMTGYPVSSLVNNSRQNSSECIIPLGEDKSLPENIF